MKCPYCKKTIQNLRYEPVSSVETSSGAKISLILRVICCPFCESILYIKDM